MQVKMQVPDQIDNIIQSVDIRELLSPGGFRDHVQNDFPQGQLIKIIRDFCICGDHVLKKVPGVGATHHLALHPGERTGDRLQSIGAG